MINCIGCKLAADISDSYTRYIPSEIRVINEFVVSAAQPVSGMDGAPKMQDLKMQDDLKMRYRLRTI